MKRHFLILFTGLSFLSLLHHGCSKDDDKTPEIPNEEELITTVIFTLQPTDGSPSIELRFTDLDGDGGNAPNLILDSIPSGTDFTASLKLLNEASVPSEDITAEIQAEDEDHQFFFKANGSLNLAVTYADEDKNGNPLGLSTTVSSGASGTGTLTITLRHLPNKFAEGVKEGKIENAGGETDIEVEFPLYVYPD